MVTTTVAVAAADHPDAVHATDNVVDEDNDYAALSNLIDVPHRTEHASHHDSILDDDQDQDGADEPVGEVTQSALNLLFKGLGDDVTPGLAGDPEGIDPTLASEERHQAALHDGQDGEVVQLETGSSVDGDGSSNAARPKRKATSRANMLTRGGACEFCKRRKLKCTAELPACAACIRASRPCVYSQKKQRSRVKMLEDRLVELERRLEGGNAPTKTGTTPAGPIYPTPPQLAIDGHSDASMAVPSEGPEPFAFPTPEASFNLSMHEVDSSLSAGLLVEPDLMTLADAAAADPAVDMSSGQSTEYPWAHMTPDAIGHAIVSAAVDGEKGVGAKIVAHL